ncbi:hypothetical protein F4677DRAFT_237480 [Hypoxylon crocopeplum]|nr:hypothetical protein F4677DRAFT_237480 [Hypoxylon crocopeplum]
MDPLSISMACITLVDLMFKASKAATSIVRDMRSAQADIDAINAEFDSIRASIDILTEGFLDRTPGQLQTKISAVVSNCATITDEIYTVLSQYQPPLGRRSLQWVCSGKKELKKLRDSLNTHGNALGIALDTVKLFVIGDVKEYTIEIKRIQEVNHAQILHRLKQIDQRLSNEGEDAMLRRWLGDMSCYAGSIIDSAETNTAELRKRYGIKSDPLHNTPSFPTSFVINRSTTSEALSHEGGYLSRGVASGAAKDSVSGSRTYPVRTQQRKYSRKSAGILSADNIPTLDRSSPRPTVRSPTVRSPTVRSPTVSSLSGSRSEVSLQTHKRGFLRRIFRRPRHDDAQTPQGSRATSVSAVSLRYYNSISSDGYLSPLRHGKGRRIFKWFLRRLEQRSKRLTARSIAGSNSVTSLSSRISYQSEPCDDRHRKGGLFMRLSKRVRRRSSDSGRNSSVGSLDPRSIRSDTRRRESAKYIKPLMSDLPPSSNRCHNVINPT